MSSICNDTVANKAKEKANSVSDNSGRVVTHLKSAAKACFLDRHLSEVASEGAGNALDSFSLSRTKKEDENLAVLSPHEDPVSVFS